MLPTCRGYFTNSLFTLSKCIKNIKQKQKLPVKENMTGGKFLPIIKN